MGRVLNPVETFSYFCFWTFAVLYSWYALFEAQTDILARDDKLQYELTDLQPGWKIIPRFKDVSDIEWGSWKYFLQTSWFYLLAQFIVSEIIRKNIKKTENLKYWYIISSTMFISLQMGVRQLLIISIQPLIYATVILCGGGKMSVWITSTLMLIGYNSVKYSYLWYILERDNLYDEEVYLLLFCVAWVLLRCISFCIDHADRNQTCKNTSKIQIIVNMLSYILYAPLLYTGPVILYEEFDKSFYVENEKLWIRLKRFVPEMLKLLLYIIFMDISLHYMYFYALQTDMDVIRKIPTIALCGGSMWMGAQFHLKYVIAYGITSAFARLDNIETPPKPRCVLRIHVYSQMWRYFDVALYKFLVRYIYRPISDLLSNLNWPKAIQSLLASLATFLFIFAWHGTVERIFIWSVLNYLGIALEYAGKTISESAMYDWFRRTFLRTEAMEVRFICVLCSPFLAISVISSSYLFAGTDMGNLYIEYLLHPTFTNSLIVCFSLYCCSQVSKALGDAPSTKNQDICKKRLLLNSVSIVNANK